MSIREAPDGPLPEKQRLVLEFVLAELGAGRPFPSLESIAAYMGWKHAGSALDCMYRLEWRGKLRRIRVKPPKHRPSLRYAWELAA